MFKKMFAAILTVALILTLNASAFATEGENLDGQHDQGMTTEYYNPFGSNYSIIGTAEYIIFWTQRAAQVVRRFMTKNLGTMCGLSTLMVMIMMGTR